MVGLLTRTIFCGFQYTLLTEMLKKAGIPSSYLVKMICDFGISPRLADIPLPPGTALLHFPPTRSSLSCHPRPFCSICSV